MVADTVVVAAIEVLKITSNKPSNLKLFIPIKKLRAKKFEVVIERGAVIPLVD